MSNPLSWAVLTPVAWPSPRSALALDAPGRLRIAGLALLAVVGVVVAALLLTSGLRILGRRLAPRFPVLGRITHLYGPARALLVVIGVWAVLPWTLRSTAQYERWYQWLQRGVNIALIVVVAWGVIAIVDVWATRSMEAVTRTDARDPRYLRTQISVLRRLVKTIVVILALAGALLTFPEVRALGTTIFASAGVLSIIAGLAAQTSLGALFAGIQIAFTGAVRLGDSVVIEDEFGTVEEITMTYVVVRLWDDRRLIVPSPYFTTTPFENWSRRGEQLIGTVDLDLSWRAPLAGLRKEFDRLVREEPLWDGQVAAFQTTDAVQGWVHVRALVSAQTPGKLFELRCAVRERLIEWIQREAPDAFPPEIGGLAGVPKSRTTA